VLAHSCAQAHWGCPIGALAAEVTRDPALAAKPAAHLHAAPVPAATWTARRESKT
jgi:hypothetical protein